MSIANKKRDSIESVLSDLYKTRFPDKMLSRKNEVWKVIVKNFLQKFIKDSDTVVDIACGYGEFINNVTAGKKIALDINPDAIGFMNDGIEFHCADASNIQKITNGNADVIFTSNFLEHLPDKKTLLGFLSDVFSSLKNGGRYIVLGPNIRYLPGAYWDYLDHNIPLTDVTTAEALNVSGFDVVQAFDRFLPYSFKNALPSHPFLVWIYLKIPVAWKILGKQFLIVAEKKEPL